MHVHAQHCEQLIGRLPPLQRCEQTVASSPPACPASSTTVAMLLRAVDRASVWSRVRVLARPTAAAPQLLRRAAHTHSPACRHQHEHKTQTTMAKRTHESWAPFHTHSCAAAAAAASSPAANGSSSAARPVRVRYAPSPTGSMHLGGLRTALYNYLFARHSVTDDGSRGEFLLRIEDTDQKRLVPEAVPSLLSAMKWAGVEHDEGPGCAPEKNTHGPYVQSERLHIYQSHIQPLLDSGAAYPCFCSAERLAELRDLQTKRGLPSMYDRLCLNMEPAEREEKLRECKEKNLPYVIRMQIPDGQTTVRDAIRGSVTFPNKTLDDQVLLKSDGFPTYHFACVVDDHLMGITHVIRGDEWITSTPKHVMLYKMLGWTVPQFAHLPLLLKPDGTKLSKRHADSSLDYYIDRGYLPSAIINFVALLGWNPGTTQEVFTMPELIRSFELNRIQKAGAVVNIDKLNWFNQQHIRLMARDHIEALCDTVRPKLHAFHRAQDEAQPLAPIANKDDLVDDEYLSRVVGSLASYVTHVDDFVTQSHFYYRLPNYQQLQSFQKQVYPDQQATNTNRALLSSIVAELRQLPDSAFQLRSTPTKGLTAPADLQDMLKACFKAHGVTQKQLFLLMRYVLTGSPSGPGVPLMIATLGRERTIARLSNQAAFEPK